MKREEEGTRKGESKNKRGMGANERSFDEAVGDDYRKRFDYEVDTLTYLDGRERKEKKRRGWEILKSVY